ncbi:MAG: TonB-dependent receptor [bacterium]|nr:TonB-dependent receptor [bacterium]
MSEPMTTQAKALALNLDPGIYGSFAEIGAGQEVGRWFFRVGGAAGTIAKTMSAYDKKVSDAIYGTAERYVSSGRLIAMLDHEYDLLIERLDPERGEESAFFAFADTVTAQNYRGDADCDGWMGIRFQDHPQSESNQIILHTRMLDPDGIMQQEALGILGVNLIYGAFKHHDRPEILLGSLLDNLGRRRIEIDMIEFSGRAFEDIDHRLLSLRLVEYGLSKAAMFSAKGEVLRPSEMLYKKPVILQRGRFRPPNLVHADIQRRAFERFAADPEVDASKIVSLLEISVGELRKTAEVGVQDFLDRLDALTASNQSVIVSDYPEYYLVAEYLARYSATQIALPMGIGNFTELIRESRYEHLPGGLLEATGRLMGQGVKVYVYPWLDSETGKRLALDTIEMPDTVRQLFDYLRDRGYVQPLEGLSDDALRVKSDHIYQWIRDGNPRWEKHVEPGVAEVIRKGRLFGYSGD